MLDARDLPDGQRLTADICIIGAGAAGISIALELIGTGIDVLLLESGDVRSDRETQDLNVGSVVDPRLNSAPERYRKRRFGGSMNDVDDVCTSPPAIALEARAYIPYSGWPVNPESLSSYYERALSLCETDESQKTFARDAEMAQKPLLPGFDDLNFSTATNDRYRHSEHFGDRFADRLRASANVCVLLNATVTRLQMNAAGSAIEAVMLRTLSGRSINISATRYVLAAGTLENARLLLANRDVQPNGIGNDTDNVGRFLLCPIEGKLDGLTLSVPPQTAVWYGSASTGIRSRRQLTLKAESRHRLQIGTFVARIRPQRKAGVPRGPSLLRRLAGGTSVHDSYSVEFQAEQQPQPSSRVALGEARDALGMPRLVLDWNCSVADFETVRRSIGLLGEDLERAGAGRLECDAPALTAMMTCHGPHGGNHQGTTRMGTDPRTSVVDANCRVHGVDNLYVAGPSVFPTACLGDPILTMVSLSLRLADHLRLLELHVVVPERVQSRLAELSFAPDPKTASVERSTSSERLPSLVQRTA